MNNEHNWQTIAGTLVSTLNQFSHSRAENLAIRSFEAENNACASLRIVRDLVRSEETHVSAKSNCEEHGFEKANRKCRPSLLIVLAVSKLCAAEFNIDTNCGQSPEPLIVQKETKDKERFWGKLVAANRQKNTSPFASPSEDFEDPS